MNRWRVEFSGDLRRENSDAHVTLTARASELDVLHFYGFGNETPSLGSNTYHRVDQRAAGIEPMIHLPVARRLALDLGVSVRRTRTAIDTGHFLASVKPFGVGTFRQLGARAGLTFDSRDIPDNAKRGVFASLQAAQYLDVWSAEGPFGALRGRRPPDREPVRAGARAASGRAGSVGQLPLLRCRVGRRRLVAAWVATGALRRRRITLRERRASFLPHEVFPAAAGRSRRVRSRGCWSRLSIGREQRHVAPGLRRRTVGFIPWSRQYAEHVDGAWPRRKRILFTDGDDVLGHTDVICAHWGTPSTHP